MHPWSETSEREYNKSIFDAELDDFVPSKVFDAHVHLASPESFPAGEPFSCGGVPVLSYSVADLARDLQSAFPGRYTEALCFGFPNARADHCISNEYIAEIAKSQRYFGLRLVDPRKDTTAGLEEDIDRCGFLGLKPYPDYARPEDVRNAEIPEMLPDWAMSIAHARRLIVMLHIPRPMRLEDPLNRRQLRELCRRWPGARIILAHVGRSYYLRGILGFLEELRDLPNLYFDTAMVQHWEVISHLFKNVPINRILFGTDIPIALAQGKAVEINNQYTYVTPRLWSLSICDSANRIRFTSFLNEELRAIKRAAVDAKLSKHEIEAFFYGNAKQLIQDVAGKCSS
jgi:predicted TIM-barrel fold metal-dependent hydrolase